MTNRNTILHDPRTRSREEDRHSRQGSLEDRTESIENLSEGWNTQQPSEQERSETFATASNEEHVIQRSLEQETSEARTMAVFEWPIRQVSPASTFTLPSDSVRAEHLLREHGMAAVEEPTQSRKTNRDLPSPIIPLYMKTSRITLPTVPDSKTIHEIVEKVVASPSKKRVRSEPWALPRHVEHSNQPGYSLAQYEAGNEPGHIELPHPRSDPRTWLPRPDYAAVNERSLGQAILQPPVRARSEPWAVAGYGEDTHASVAHGTTEDQHSTASFPRIDLPPIPLSRDTGASDRRATQTVVPATSMETLESPGQTFRHPNMVASNVQITQRATSDERQAEEITPEISQNTRLPTIRSVLAISIALANGTEAQAVPTRQRAEFSSVDHDEYAARPPPQHFEQQPTSGLSHGAYYLNSMAFGTPSSPDTVMGGDGDAQNFTPPSSVKRDKHQSTQFAQPRFKYDKYKPVHTFGVGYKEPSLDREYGDTPRFFDTLPDIDENGRLEGSSATLIEYPMRYHMGPPIQPLDSRYAEEMAVERSRAFRRFQQALHGQTQFEEAMRLQDSRPWLM